MRPGHISSTSCGSLSPSAAAAVFASRAEIPIRIAPVTSFSSAQRPVSSSSSSQRESCFGNSVLPSVRSVVTTSVSGRRRRVVVAGQSRLRPHQRHRLREVADVIIRQPEQHRIGAIGDEVADQSRLGVLERQRAGQRRQRIAAIGIVGLAKIGRDQPQLVVAAGLIGEAIEQFGEAVHASASPAGDASPSSSSP